MTTTTTTVVTIVQLQLATLIVSNTVKAEVHKHLSIYHGGYTELSISFVLC